MTVLIRGNWQLTSLDHIYIYPGGKTSTENWFLCSCTLHCIWFLPQTEGSWFDNQENPSSLWWILFNLVITHPRGKGLMSCQTFGALDSSLEAHWKRAVNASPCTVFLFPVGPILVSSSPRIGMRGRELMGGIGKTMMQSGGTFGTFMAIGMGIRC